MHIPGNLIITAADLAEYQDVTSVGGDLVILAPDASLPALATVGGNIWIYAAGAMLPALESVGLSLEIRAAGVSLPALTSVHGERIADLETARARLAEVAKHALAEPDALDMSVWHTCSTTHCIAGWAIHLAGEYGRDLEERFGSRIAGNILLGIEGSQLFFLSTEEAASRLREYL